MKKILVIALFVMWVVPVPAEALKLECQHKSIRPDDKTITTDLFEIDIVQETITHVRRKSNKYQSILLDKNVPINKTGALLLSEGRYLGKFILGGSARWFVIDRQTGEMESGVGKFKLSAGTCKQYTKPKRKF